MNKSTLLFLSTLTAFTFCSCGDGEKSEEIETVDSVTTEKPNVDNLSETFFQVPSPGEMLTFIKMVGGKNNNNVSFLNPVSNEKKYTDNKSKALNFGVYSCDLSYCSIFGIGSESLKYFKTVKGMGEEIGVSTAIKPEVLKRIEANIGQPDSLALITDDVYFSTFEALEAGQQGATLSLVVAGGWLESIFIATNLAKYEEKSPLIDRLADQKYTLENLIDFLKKYDSDANVVAVKTDFEGLLLEFNKIGEKDVEKINSKKSNTTAMLGGGKQLVITKEIYDSISAKIKTIRNSYTLTK